MSSVAFLSRYGRLVAFSHSVFALPFALSSFYLAWLKGSLVELPSLFYALTLIVLALVSARTAAMGFNRLVDAVIDSRNPRTSARELPSGQLSQMSVVGLVCLSSALFFLFSALLGNHCLVLAPLVLVILLGYSLTKRFTVFAHLALGLALGLAPAGAWWVLRPAIEVEPVILLLAVMFWVAGFDILYSLQDVEFDRREGLFSIPAMYGVDRALALSSVFHAITLGLFLLLGILINLASFYFVGLLLIGLLLYWQHLIVKPWDFSRINRAFFTLNGFVSIAYFLLILSSR